MHTLNDGVKSSWASASAGIFFEETELVNTLFLVSVLWEKMLRECVYNQSACVRLGL